MRHKYTRTQRREILEFAARNSVTQALAKYGVSAVTIYRWRHPEYVAAQAVKRREYYRAHARQYYNEHTAACLISRREYQHSAPGRIVMRKAYYRYQDKNRASRNLRGRMRASLKGADKSETTRALRGCTVTDYVAYLEALFEPGMTWANYGKAWDIHHKRPCYTFDLTDPAQQRECLHFTNTEPVWCEAHTALHSSMRGKKNDATTRA